MGMKDSPLHWGNERQSLTLREQSAEEIIEGSRKLHNEELYDLYSSQNTIWVTKSIKGFLVGKPEGKRPYSRPWHKWEDNIHIHIKETKWEGVD
jgi:hypothetical protein